jgi:prophage DNA circulation protein
MPRWTKEQAFETAIIDGINMFVREVLNAKGYLVPEKADYIAMPPILELKYQLARDLARKWAKMSLVDEAPALHP